MKRIETIAENKVYTEEQVMSAVRKFMAPGHLQTLLFAPNIKLQDIFTIIGEWEEMQSRKRANRREMKQENYKVKIREKKLNDGL